MQLFKALECVPECVLSPDTEDRRVVKGDLSNAADQWMNMIYVTGRIVPNQLIATAVGLVWLLWCGCSLFVTLIRRMLRLKPLKGILAWHCWRTTALHCGGRKRPCEGLDLDLLKWLVVPLFAWLNKNAKYLVEYPLTNFMSTWVHPPKTVPFPRWGDWPFSL